MRPDALLLLGPTGVGKSPLGELLEAVGWEGRRCHHFDFGAHLRAVAERTLEPDGLLEADRAVVVHALETGALLEDDEFPIAETILRDFLRRRAVGEADLVVLDGLPRHQAQAEAVDTVVAVRTVVHLEAGPDVLLQRIALDTGGDRTGRIDDGAEAVRRRVERFRARTRPLLDRYGDRVRTVVVGSRTRAEDVLRDLARD